MHRAQIRYHVPYILRQPIRMDKTLKFNGIPFRVKYEQGALTNCTPLCPVCESEVVKQVARNGTPMYVCATEGRGCENPVMSFSCVEEMAELEATAALEIAKYLQRGADVTGTYHLRNKPLT